MLYVDPSGHMLGALMASVNISGMLSSIATSIFSSFFMKADIAVIGTIEPWFSMIPDDGTHTSVPVPIVSRLMRSCGEMFPDEGKHLGRNAENRCPDTAPVAGIPDSEGAIWEQKRVSVPIYGEWVDKWRAAPGCSCDGCECDYNEAGDTVVGGTYNFEPDTYGQKTSHVCQDVLPHLYYNLLLRKQYWPASSAFPRRIDSLVWRKI